MDSPSQTAPVHRSQAACGQVKISLLSFHWGRILDKHQTLSPLALGNDKAARFELTIEVTMPYHYMHI